MEKINNLSRTYIYRDEYGEEKNAVFLPYAGNPDDIDMYNVESGIEGFIRWTGPFLDKGGAEI